MNERTKRITIKERTFILNKMPAAKGFSILAEIVTRVIPPGVFSQSLSNILPVSMLNAPRNQMSIEEMEQLQVKIIRYVSEELQSGPVPLVDSQGNFQVEDIEYDMMLFGELLVKMIMFQYTDFFTEGLGKLGATAEDSEAIVKNLAQSLSVPLM